MSKHECEATYNYSTDKVNRLIHTKVLGWRRYKHYAGSISRSNWSWKWRQQISTCREHRFCKEWMNWEFCDTIPNYCGDLRESEKVIKYFHWSGTQRGLVNVRGRYYAWTCYWNGNKGEGIASEFAMAICLAAIQAKGVR